MTISKEELEALRAAEWLGFLNGKDVVESVRPIAHRSTWWSRLKRKLRKVF